MSFCSRNGWRKVIFYEVDRQARPGNEETVFNGLEESGNNGAIKTRVVVHGQLGFGFVKS